MALNQLQTKAESALAAVSSIDEIAHIRIITKAGGSRKATPAQASTLLAPLLGMDYSLLTEQIVPGEFALNYKGERKQVYARGISLSAGVVPTMPYRQNIGLSGIVGGIVSAYTKAIVSPIYRGDSDSVVIISEPEQGILNMNVRGFLANQLLANSTIYISGYIKYTK